MFSYFVSKFIQHKRIIFNDMAVADAIFNGSLETSKRSEISKAFTVNGKANPASGRKGEQIYDGIVLSYAKEMSRGNIFSSRYT